MKLIHAEKVAPVAGQLQRKLIKLEARHPHLRTTMQDSLEAYTDSTAWERRIIP
jgi:hypothetical protein